MELTYKDIDYRRFLIRHYKYYKLSEVELVLLLCLDDFLQNVEALVTADDLIPYMNISKEEIDALLVGLVDKKFVSYETNSSNNVVTCLHLLYDKILKDMKKDILIEQEQISNTQENQTINNLYVLFEKLIGRSLSPKELDRISLWIQNGVSTNLINEAISKLKAKGSSISIASIDKVLFNLQKASDVQEKGYSDQGTSWNRMTQKERDILSKRWIEEDD